MHRKLFNIFCNIHFNQIIFFIISDKCIYEDRNIYLKNFGLYVSIIVLIKKI